jgi:HK97 family phage prohead protease
MEPSYKQAGVVVTNANDSGQLEAIVAVLNNTDLDGEVMRPGFFSKSLATKLPKGVWAHNWSQPVAKTLEARELQPGDPLLPEAVRSNGAYYIKAQFNLETQRGREAFSDVKNGLIDEFSVGYFTTKDYTDPQTGNRNLLEGDWIEWSPVLAGANPSTSVIGVKGRVGAKLDFPIAPRDTPFDRKTAEGHIRDWSDAKDAPNAQYKQAFFWHDPDQGDNFGAHKLPFVAKVDDKMMAVPSGIFRAAAIMQGARGGVNMPDADRPKVRAAIGQYYTKMAKHFDDDSITVPWDTATGKSRNPHDGLRLVEHFEALLDETDEVVARFKSLWGTEGMRTKEGRVLAAAHVERIKTVMDHLTTAHQTCGDILNAATPKLKAGDVPTEDEMELAFERFMRINQMLREQGITPQ